MERELLYALMGTGFTCGATIVGAALVFFFKKDITKNAQRIFLGFAAGIMIAASVWSLIMPALDKAEELGQSPVLMVTLGFVAGVAFLLVLDNFLPHLHPEDGTREGPPAKLKKNMMIVIAVTLHNIPEGMAVGLVFAAAAADMSPASWAAALALAVGMGLQNLPEGAAVSLPLRTQGMSRKKAFFLGAMSGVVEPVFGILAVLVAGSIGGIMPFILAFAAGAMMYVVVEEMIPEASLGEHSHTGTISVMAGFLLMMIFDIVLS